LAQAENWGLKGGRVPPTRGPPPEMERTEMKEKKKDEAKRMHISYASEALRVEQEDAADNSPK